MIPTYRMRYVEVLEFTHFVMMFEFNPIGHPGTNSDSNQYYCA